jgi:peptidoglycan/LPS O-acetylase OafA/YrhL
MDEVSPRVTRFSLGEVPSLDGLRGVSVLLVMLLHFDWLGCGWVGVQFFFVLSGFLISSNLFLSQNSLPVRTVLLSFYAKRFLRIFPLYYFALALYFVFEKSPIFLHIFTEKVRAEPHAWLSHGLFLQNYSDSLFGGSIRVLAHFWSLAVEEQFYVVFPFIAVLLPRKWLALLACALVICDPAIRAWIGNVSVYKNTLSQSDAFALGILLSLGWLNHGFRHWCERNRSLIARSLSIYLAFLLIVGLVMLHECRSRGIPIGNTTLGFQVSTDFGSHIWIYSAVDLVGMGLTLFCLVNPTIRLFSNSALRYIGRISFGLYVFHYPVAFALE